jgi:hypothetical protein
MKTVYLGGWFVVYMYTVYYICIMLCHDITRQLRATADQTKAIHLMKMQCMIQ